MIAVDDKDAIIKHLEETLDNVSQMVEDLDYNSDFEEFNKDQQKIIDYIWHRKADVAF